MAIFQVQGFTAQLLGDGASTTFTVDLAGNIALRGLLPTNPSAIFNVTQNGWTGGSVVAYSLHKAEITVTLDSAPPANVFAQANFNLLF